MYMVAHKATTQLYRTIYLKVQQMGQDGILKYFQATHKESKQDEKQSN